MELSQHSRSLIESAIQRTLGRYSSGCEQTIVTDIHIQPNPTTGQLYIFDDEDKELAFANIDEWSSYEGDDFYECIERSLRNILCQIKENGELDNLTILKPYSFVLVDEDKESISDLLLVDDDTLLLNSELLQGLDEELDDFLRELLEK